MGITPYPQGQMLFFTQLGYKSCEVPVTRKYPNAGKVPTKISFLGGNTNLLKILFANLFGRYNPDEVKK